MNALRYKNYIGFVEFDADAEIFHGEVINTKDVITFQGTTVSEIKKEFIASIDDYLEFCASRKELPEKPFSGDLHMRLDPILHREAYLAARHDGKSLNKWITEVISKAVLQHS
jgi:predicted HicB family RNase H-like nuclease